MFLVNILTYQALTGENDAKVYLGFVKARPCVVQRAVLVLGSLTWHGGTLLACASRCSPHLHSGWYQCALWVGVLGWAYGIRWDWVGHAVGLAAGG